MAFKDYFSSCSCILSCQWLCGPKDRTVNSLHLAIQLQLPRSRGTHWLCHGSLRNFSQIESLYQRRFILPQTQLQNQQHQEIQANAQLMKRRHGAIWATESDTASKCHWGAVKSHLNSSATEWPISTTEETQMLYVAHEYSCCLYSLPLPTQNK